MVRVPLLVFFLLACVISWTIWSPLWLPTFGVQVLPVLPYHHALGAVGPIAAGIILTAWECGGSGVRELISRMVRWQGNVLWIVVAIVAPLLLLIVAAVAGALFADEALTLKGIGLSSEFPQFSPLLFFLYNVFSFGYGEETGWRGYALPRLQARHSALVATLLLTVGWAIWHIPLFFYRPGYTGMGIAGIAGWFFSLLTGAVLLTWLFNQSRGSILVVALFHAAVDVAFTSRVSSEFIINGAGAIITIWGICVLVVAGPRYLARCGKVVLSGCTVKMSYDQHHPVQQDDVLVNS
jgi:membrane protease YdiL (CAAX protease family)